MFIFNQMNDDNHNQSYLKRKINDLKNKTKLKMYYYILGITIATMIIIIVNVIRKVANKLSKNPENTKCTSFKNTTINIILTIVLILNLYLSFPQYLYKYRIYNDKISKLKEKVQ
jgi:uncharacterized membrane protein